MSNVDGGQQHSPTNAAHQPHTVAWGLTRWRPWLEPLALGAAIIALIRMGRSVAEIGRRELLLASLFGTLVFGVFVAARTIPQLHKGGVHVFALVLLGFCVLYFIAASGTVFSCVFFHRPIDLRHWIDPTFQPGISPTELPAGYQMQLDVTSIGAPPAWLYPPGAARDDQARLRANMAKWISWAALGVQKDGDGKLFQATWDKGFPGRHSFSATLRLGDHDRANYVVMDGIVFVVDDTKAKENILSFRQFPLKVDENAPEKVDPTCKFDEVRPGEKLYLLLSVFPKDKGTIPGKLQMWLEKTP